MSQTLLIKPKAHAKRNPALMADHLAKAAQDMQRALLEGAVDELKDMFAQGAPLRWGQGYGLKTDSPLEMAIKTANLEAAKIIFEAMKSASDPADRKAGMGLLSWAASSSSPSVLQWAIDTLETEQGPCSKWIDLAPRGFPHGRSALLIAAGRDNVKCVQLLMDLGANLSARDASGADAVECAVRGLNAEAALILAQTGGASNVNDAGHTPLMVAIQTRFADGISALAPRSDPLARDPKGRSALLMAACDSETPMGALEALATGMRGSTVYERQLAEVSAAMGAAAAVGNDQGWAMLGEIVESIVLKIELGATLPTGAAPSKATKKRL